MLVEIDNLFSNYSDFYVKPIDENPFVMWNTAIF